jgi:hypothetical protein
VANSATVGMGTLPWVIMSVRVRMLAVVVVVTVGSGHSVDCLSAPSLVHDANHSYLRVESRPFGFLARPATTSPPTSYWLLVTP